MSGFDPGDLNGHLALWRAVVCRAIADTQGKNDEHMRSALRWLLSTSTSPGSFLWACDMLDLEAGRIVAWVLPRQGASDGLAARFSSSV